MDNFKDEAEKLIDIIKDKKDENQVVPKQDPMGDLTRNIFHFFTDRMHAIEKRESLVDKAQQKLEDFLDEPDISFDDVMAIYRLVSSKSTESAESLISLFKPTPGAGSPLAEAVSREKKEDDSVDNFFRALTPDQLEKVDLLFRMLKAEKGNTIEENDAEIITAVPMPE